MEQRLDSSLHTKVGPLGAEDARRLHDDGFLVLRGVIPMDWIVPLRAAFEAGERSSLDWPVPRGHDWRHALVDLDPAVQRVCRLPLLLAIARHLLHETFFVAQVEGREPRAGGGAQLPHRDGPDASQLQTVSALAFLDPFGPENGATQVMPGTHRRKPPIDQQAILVSGQPGDVLLFSSNLLHGATCNVSGARRRTLLISYVPVPLREDYAATRDLRAVRMNTDETFGN